MSLPESPADLDATLHDRFGLERFRAGQREVIEEVIRGRDVLCVMPTGGGKSLCYQLPAILLPRITLVVSPLIALMKDQVDALRQRGVAATLLNSTLDPSEQRTRLAEIVEGQFHLVYVAPERFRSGNFLKAMAALKPSLLAIDEAHCISQWGHDFRPDYSRLGHARKLLGSPPCVALTATATDVVRRDIADQLDLQDPALFVSGFDRPNLIYRVKDSRRDLEKLQDVAQALDQNPGPAIVYASSRARCVMIADYLRTELRKEAVVYHAGLTREERTSAQEQFMEGDAEVVVATNAFGMGVDKADIRSVIHFNMPGTLEAYYQEAGRAGRDGLPAECLLLYAPGDRILQERFIENEYPPPDVVHQVFDYLRKLDDDPIEKTQAEIKDLAGIELNESAVGTALKLLEGASAIERFMPRENMAIVRINVEPEGDEPVSLVGRLGPQAHIQRIVLTGLEGLVNRRYSEPIYFHPDDFATALGLDRPALGRALKALTAELPIDYVPPFRGNAIRVLDRSRRPRDLDIDFASLRKRKQREYDKLERIVKYAQAKRCRRAFILGYFGDASADTVHCGRCDNCISDGVSAEPSTVIDTPSGLEVVLKVLSGVARAKGRFGKTVVAQMLKGSGSEKMERMGLKNLSTYGILPNFAVTEIARIIDALTEAGLVEAPEVDRFRPIVTLSEAGWDRLKDRSDRPIALTLPDDLALKIQGGRKPAPAARPVDEIDPNPGEIDPALAHDPLFESLRTLRSEYARQLSQPAYCIFTNQTLEAIVRSRPTTPGNLAAVKGFGASRLERFGAAILELIAAFPAPAPSPALSNVPIPQEPAPKPSRATNGEPAPSTVPPPPPSPPRPVERATAPQASYVPTEEWTWRLIERGFTLEDVAAIRGLDRTAIVRHLTLSARQGKPIELGSFLDKATGARWNEWRSQHGDAVGPPPEDFRLSELWTLFITLTTNQAKSRPAARNS
jgi:ATP-dependent DNA helicase RecQ